MKKNLMRVFVLALLLVILGMTAASAAEYKYLKGINMTLPAGLETTKNEYNAETGVYTLTIDSENTDWALVAAQARSQGASRVNFMVDNSDITDPIDYQFCATPYLEKGANIYTAEAGLNMLYDDFCAGGMKGGNGSIFNFCQLNTATQMVVPYDFSGNDILIAYLAKLKNGKVEARYARFNISFTDARARLADVAVPEEDITADTEVGAADREISDGYVLYKLSNESAKSSVNTKIAVPAGMKKVEVIGSGSSDRKTYSIADDQTAFNIEVFFDGNSQNTFKTETKSLLWYDSNEEGSVAKKGQRLVVGIQKGESKIYPTYVNGITPVEFEDSDIGVVKNGKPIMVPFLHKVYNGGVITVSKKDGADATMNMDLADSMLQMDVFAMQGAEKYKAISVKQTGVYNSANREMQYQGLVDTLNAPSTSVKDIPESGIISITELPIFRVTERADNPGLKVFYAESLAEGEAYVCLIEWLDGTGKPLGRQWFAIHIDKMSFLEEGDVLTQLPTKKQSVPGIITEQDASLIVDMLPQLSEKGNQIQYDLSLVNDEGELVGLKEKTRVVLPLPQGEYSAVSVNHYADDQAETAEDKFDTDSILITENALIVEVDSLSPFVVSWETADTAGVETLPATGDESLPLAALLAIAASSMAALVMMRKKSAKQN